MIEIAACSLSSTPSPRGDARCFGAPVSLLARLPTALQSRTQPKRHGRARARVRALVWQPFVAAPMIAPSTPAWSQRAGPASGFDIVAADMRNIHAIMVSLRRRAAPTSLSRRLGAHLIGAWQRRT